MRGRFERSVRPVVVASQDDVRAIFDLALEAHRLSVAEKPDFELIAPGPSAAVTLQNGDSFKCTSSEDIFEIRDVRSNPIREVAIEGGYHSIAHLSVKVGGRWSHSQGATLLVHSDQGFAQRAEHVLNSLFVREKALSDIIPTARPFWLTLIVVAYLGYATNFVVEGLRIVQKDGALWGGFLAICILAVFSTFLAMDSLQYRFLGRATFNWGDGQIRYEKIVKIVNFALWTFPLTVAVKLFIN